MKLFVYFMRTMVIAGLVVVVLLGIGAVRSFMDGATGSGIFISIFAGAILFSIGMMVFKMGVFEPIEREKY